MREQNKALSAKLEELLRSKDDAALPTQNTEAAAAQRLVAHNPTHRSGSGHKEHALPDAIRAFVPISRRPGLALPLAELAKAEELVAATGGEDAVAIASLRSAIESTAQATRSGIAAMVKMDGVLVLADCAVTAGTENFVTVYEGVWSMCFTAEKAGIAAYKAAVDCLAAAAVGQRAQQRAAAADPLQLYLDALASGTL